MQKHLVSTHQEQAFHHCSKYENFRDLADGDIMFIKAGSSPLAKFVAWWTVNRYSHVAIVFWYADRLLLAESI